MRVLTNLLLVSLLASCPVLCGSAGEVLGLHCDHHSTSPTPGPVPANDDDCVCNGALLHASSTVRIADLNPEFLPLPLDMHGAIAFLATPVLPTFASAHALPNGQLARGVAIVTLLPVVRC